MGDSLSWTCRYVVSDKTHETVIIVSLYLFTCTLLHVYFDR